MTENANTLKQADAIVTVEGILAEKKLEAVKTPDGKDVIRGSLVVKVDDTHMITLNVYVGKLTNAGTENRAYSGMLTVMNEYKSIAEVGIEEATKIRCRTGSLQPNTYIDRATGEVRTNVRYSASFVNRVDESSAKGFVPQATFEVEGYINSLRDEVDKTGEPTGRLILSLLVPTYKMIEPLELIISEENASDFESNFEIGQTAKFFGTLENNVIVRERTVCMAFGTAAPREEYDYIDERIVTGASKPYGEEQAYTQEAIKAAMTERSIQIDKMKADAVEERKKAAQSPAGMGHAQNSRPLPKFSI